MDTCLSLRSGSEVKRRTQRLHVVLSCSFDLAGMERDAAADESPRHAMYTLARRLNAIVYDPSDERPTRADALLAKIIGTPEHWALARRLARTLGPCSSFVPVAWKP